MEPSAASTTVTGPVAELLQAGTEDTPVLDRPAPLRLPYDSGARYKYPDLLTYLLTTYIHDVHKNQTKPATFSISSSNHN